MITTDMRAAVGSVSLRLITLDDLQSNTFWRAEFSSRDGLGYTTFQRVEGSLYRSPQHEFHTRRSVVHSIGLGFYPSIASSNESRAQYAKNT